jgi:hypothetical protein
VQSTSLQSAGNAAPAAAAGPLALSRPPIQPSGTSTGAAIEANMAPVPPSPGPLPAPSPQAKAQLAVSFSEKWVNQLSRAADLMGVDLHGALRFAHADVRRVIGDLNHHAPTSRLTRDTNHLLTDWASKGDHAIKVLQHGLFRNSEQDLRGIGADLSRAGVTNPGLQAALGEAGTLLRQFDAIFSRGPGVPGGPGIPGPGIPGGPTLPGGPSLPGAPGIPGPGIPSIPIGAGAQGAIGGMIGFPPIGGGLGQLEQMLRYAQAKIGAAATQEAKAHPENVPALQAAMAGISNSFRQMEQGLVMSNAMRLGMLGELARINGGFPQPSPQPQPVPLPWPQPQAA